jgi:hypothetical protein
VESVLVDVYDEERQDLHDLGNSITQPVSLVNANGQPIETTIDMKALGGQPGSGNPVTSMPSAPMAVPVSTSWTTDAGTSGHYDLVSVLLNFFSSLLTMRPNKLECLYLAVTFSSSLTFAGKTRSLPKKGTERCSSWVGSGLVLKF